MANKNIRNDSGYNVINFNSQAGPTGQTGPMGGSSVYSNSGLIPLTWDRDDLLQGGPYNNNIICERIGNMLFVKILETVSGTPQGSNALFYSPTGIIPLAYRPSAKRFSMALVANGFQDGLPILNMTYGYSTILGGCFLYPDGTLEFGTSQGPRVGPLTTDGVSLYPFQGPHICGVMAQTLVFSLE